MFTWNNRRGGTANVQECLDHFLANKEWSTLFPRLKVSHLDFGGSNHWAVLADLEANLEGMYLKQRRKLFRFKPWWLRDEECMEIILSEWL
ncbi:Endonuclease/exonuclease/phosphatase, partial [Parasponia andersonii]